MNVFTCLLERTFVCACASTVCVRFVFVSVLCVCAYHILTGNRSSVILYLWEVTLSPVIPYSFYYFVPLPSPHEGVVINLRGRKMLF